MKLTYQKLQVDMVTGDRNELINLERRQRLHLRVGPPVMGYSLVRHCFRPCC